MDVVVTKRILAKSWVECHVMEVVVVNVLSEVIVVSLPSEVVFVIVVVAGRLFLFTVDSMSSKGCVSELLSVIVAVGSCVLEPCL